MMASTHLAFGLFSATGLFALFSQSLHRELPAVGAVILGALLPDVDTPQSALGRLLPFLSIPLERRWGHRSLSHSLLAVAGLALLGLPLWGYYRGSVYAALLLGYLSHLLADCATKSGVPLFYPHPLQCVLPGNPRYRVTTGSLAERGLLLGLLLLLGLVFPLSSLGGVWQAVRYLLATQPAAYRDYRDATTEVQLVFRGRWQHSRQPVAGQARILVGIGVLALIGVVPSPIAPCYAAFSVSAAPHPGYASLADPVPLANPTLNRGRPLRFNRGNPPNDLTQPTTHPKESLTEVVRIPIHREIGVEECVCPFRARRAWIYGIFARTQAPPPSCRSITSSV